MGRDGEEKWINYQIKLHKWYKMRLLGLLVNLKKYIIKVTLQWSIVCWLESDVKNKIILLNSNLGYWNI